MYLYIYQKRIYSPCNFIEWNRFGYGKTHEEEILTTTTSKLRTPNRNKTTTWMTIDGFHPRNSYGNAIDLFPSTHL